jgi:plasmid stabilization system protein ParE
VTLIWSPRSLLDLEGIRDHIAQDSEVYASLVVQRLLAAAERLLDFPKQDRVVPEIGDEALRELIVRPYRLVYRISEDDRIEIVTIFRASRLLPEVG